MKFVACIFEKYERSRHEDFDVIGMGGNGEGGGH